MICLLTKRHFLCLSCLISSVPFSHQTLLANIQLQNCICSSSSCFDWMFSKLVSNSVNLSSAFRLFAAWIASDTMSCKFIPQCLLNFIVWLVNDSCFYQENNYEETSNDILRKCISIAECVISLHKKTVCTFQRRSCTSVSFSVEIHIVWPFLNEATTRIF
jgi:hypothetical protein